MNEEQLDFLLNNLSGPEQDGHSCKHPLNGSETLTTLDAFKIIHIHLCRHSEEEATEEEATEEILTRNWLSTLRDIWWVVPML